MITTRPTFLKRSSDKGGFFAGASRRRSVFSRCTLTPEGSVGGKAGGMDAAGPWWSVDSRSHALFLGPGIDNGR